MIANLFRMLKMSKPLLVLSIIVLVLSGCVIDSKPNPDVRELPFDTPSPVSQMHSEDFKREEPFDERVFLEDRIKYYLEERNKVEALLEKGEGIVCLSFQYDKDEDFYLTINTWIAPFGDAYKVHRNYARQGNSILKDSKNVNLYSIDDGVNAYLWEDLESGVFGIKKHSTLPINFKTTDMFGYLTKNMPIDSASALEFLEQNSHESDPLLGFPTLNCQSWEQDRDVFNVPAHVEFIDMTQAVKDPPETNPKNLEEPQSGYYKKDGHVYCDDIKTNLDAASFEASDSGLHAKDKDGVYRIMSGCAADKRELLLPQADPESFAEISIHQAAFYTKDKNHVFLDDNILEKADPESFEVVKAHYAKDKNYYFERGVLVESWSVNPEDLLPKYE